MNSFRQIIKYLKDTPQYFNTYEPLEQEVGDFLRTKTRTPKLYSNDLRHQYASAVFTQKHGTEAAKFWGDINEVFGASGRYDKERDQRANAIGREYGIKYPNYTKQQLLEILFQEYIKNKQRTDAPYSRSTKNYTRSDIANMNPQEYQVNRDAIFNQLQRTGTIPQ